MMNDMLDWPFSSATIIIGGSSCSATSTVYNILKSSNHFKYDTTKELRFFYLHCEPHLTFKEYVAVPSILNPVKALTADVSFRINSDYHLIPWNLTNYCTVEDWQNYLYKMGHKLDVINNFQLEMDTVSQKKEKYPQIVEHGRLNNWSPFESKNIYYYDLSPQYIRAPYSAKSIALMSPHSKFMFVVRETVRYIDRKSVV
jgi:hypothetical protein